MNYYVVYDTGDRCNPIPKGWKLLYKICLLSDNYIYTKIKQVKDEEELKRHQEIAKYFKNYKIMTKEQLLKDIKKTKKLIADPHVLKVIVYHEKELC